MAEGTYEFECMRAELLGIEKPNEELFEKQRSERLKKEQEEQEAAELALLDNQEEGLKNTSDKFDEINSILSSTQKKLNRFKQTACTSFSGLLHRGSIDLSDMGERKGSVGSASGGGGGSIDGGRESSDLNAALDNLDELQQNQSSSGDDVQPIIPTEKIRAAKLDLQNKVSSQLSKLDSLIHKAEHAEVAMTEQTQQMRKMTK